MAADSVTYVVGGWLLTYLLHSTALLGGALLGFRVIGRRLDRFRETGWRIAFFGGTVTATCQTYIASWQSTLSGHHLATPIDSAPHVMDAEAWRRGLFTVFTQPEVDRVLTIALSCWAVLALTRLASLMRAYRAQQLLLSSRVRVTHQPWKTSIWTPDSAMAISTSARIATPMVVGAHEICLPARALDELNDDEVEAVLAHEYAHIERHDCAWLTLASIAQCALFVQPLNRLALARLRSSAECACDDEAIRRTGKHVPLATALARVTEWLTDSAYSPLAIGLTSGESFAVARVRRILDPDTLRVAQMQSGSAMVYAGVIVTGVMTLVPGVVLRGGDANSVVAHRPASRYVIQAHDDAGTFTLTVDGSRVVGVVLDGRQVASSRLRQRGDQLHVEDTSGRAPLDITLTASGGIRWTSRPSSGL